MSSQRTRDDTEPSTREALLDAALDQLERKGVLAGLNLREVASDVGVTPANIYHYFGSRQGLLRAALSREMERLEAPLAAVAGASFVERRVRMFDAITSTPTLALTALLALDGDPDYEPMPFLTATRAHYAALVERGDVPADLDIDAAHLLGTRDVDRVRDLRRRGGTSAGHHGRSAQRARAARVRATTRRPRAVAPGAPAAARRR